MSTWKPIGVVTEGNRINIAGTNPWNHDWVRSKDGQVQLPHPKYLNQMHSFSVFSIETGGWSIVFAAGELSASVWAFYVPA